VLVRHCGCSCAYAVIYSAWVSVLQVPNIRFNVAKELANIAPVCGQSVYETQISPVLSVLLEDADQDVRFFAERTLKILGKEFGSGGK
jgi:hypothetical protein